MAERKEHVRRWYKSARWKRMRREQLERHPYCQCPHHEGNLISANTVDHIKPHRGDSRLFWNPANLQSMAKTCHDKYKQSQERGGHGFLVGCNENGEPLSKEHPWYGK